MSCDELLNMRPIEGVDDELAKRVCAGLYLKRQGKSSVDIDVEKMAVHYNSDKETMVKVIQWYETQLINTTFTYDGRN